MPSIASIVRGLALIWFIALPALAGPLDPPVGPIAPTQKPLAEVEPRVAINATNTPGDADSLFRITQPGSYYLTGNITGVAAKHGIQIAANHVTLDLNGFTLTGVASSFDGISRDSAAVGAIIIRNGHVTGWGASGIDFEGIPTTLNLGARFESIIATGNGNDGFGLPDGSTVVGCSSLRNGAHGYDVSNHATFHNCVAQANTLNGFEGGFGCSFANCISRANQGDGFRCFGPSIFEHCASSNNSTAGFNVVRSTIIACEAGFNNVGFEISNGTIQHSSADGNSNTGILAAGNVVVLSNNIHQGTLGISVTGDNNRIEGNNISDAATGINVTSSGNIIIRNTCSDSTTHYVIAVNNRYGPIVNITGTGAAAVSGNTAPSTLTSTDPNANFAY